MAAKQKSKVRKTTPAWGGYVKLNIDAERRADVEAHFDKYSANEPSFYALVGETVGRVEKVAFSCDDQGGYCCTINLVRRSTNTLHVISSFASTWQFAFFVSWYKFAILLDGNTEDIEDAEITDAIWR